MANIIDTLIVVALVVSGAICAWAVLTPNHLFIG